MIATRIHSILLATIATVMFVTTGAGVTTAHAQTSAEQKCINGINKAASKVAATVGKQNAKCVGDRTKQKVTDVDVCVDGDTKGKILKATGKVASTDTKLCTGVGVSPPFGFTDVATAGQAGQDAERALVRLIFGTTIQAAISTAGGGDSKCQASVIKAAEKLAATVGKDFVKCKKDGLKAGTITSAAGLEACIGANLKLKIDKAKDKVAKTTDKCTIGSFSTVFPGSCGGSQAVFTACVQAKAAGQTCVAINEIDGLGANCDLVDDGINNGSTPFCGNGFVDAGEACDDGNAVDDGNGCDAVCQDNSVCGDGTIQSVFEDCDDAGESATCDADCTNVACGDGVTNTTAGEVCDDGANNDTGDGFCTSACTSVQTCGDSTTEGTEECDDGNAINEDGCTNACTLPVCGDGIVNGIDECDDGNAVNNDGCTNACTLPVCGDSIVNGTDECDDGNAVDNDGCTNACTLPVCGDGIINGSDQCDDGNTIDDGNGCGADCTLVQNAGCPDRGLLTFYAGTSEEPCASTADCTTAGHPGTCDTGLGVCVTASILDVGWTGVSHGGDVIDGNVIAGNLLCPGGGAPGPCGECLVTGIDASTDTCRCSHDTSQRCDVPFDFDGATGARGCGTGVVCAADSDCKYCTGDPSVKCNVNGDCSGVGGTCFGGTPRLTCNTGSGICEGICDCYLGPPLPLSAGNVPVCVLNRFSEDVVGTANVDLGESELTSKLRSVVFLAASKVQPCPLCGGTCSAPLGSKCSLPAVNKGNPCTVNSNCDSSPGSSDGVCRSSLGDSCFLDTDCDIIPGDGDGVCDGFDPVIGDGVQGGTCFGGDFDGQACDIDGRSPSFPAFPGSNGGGTALDCFPTNGTNVSGQGLKIELSTTTGTATLGANVSCGGFFFGAYNCPCKVCSGNTSIGCNSDAECSDVGAGLCSSNGSGEQAQPNDCDPAGIGGDGTVGLCVSTGGVDEFGECADPGDVLFNCDGVVRADGSGFLPCDPVITQCSDEKGGQGPGGQTDCLVDADCKRCSISDDPCADALDCPGVETCDDTGVTCQDTDCIFAGTGLPPAFDKTLAGDCTVANQRPCFLDPIKAVGVADPNAPVGVATFCIPPTINSSVNAVAGLPGPGRTKLQVTSDLTCPGGAPYTPAVGGCP